MDEEDSVVAVVAVVVVKKKIVHLLTMVGLYKVQLHLEKLYLFSYQ